uniref:Bifunctional lysine-specific demethylase and histidyl-hydroxylase n=1 Tax=Macrostomum lignano TaxID=282301 RepID=A0A1I8ID18_9PLAT
HYSAPHGATGKRETHNPEGRALASQTWQFYQSGCSLRLLCPQVFHDRVYQKLSILHELFGSFVGANVYLTPPGTQGFAPHWDDIEAFVMQLEGRKHWRVYAPRSPNERLPRESSGNFGPKDRLGQPVIDAVLEPGDLLYMPRGFIHQGRCLDGWHSLHITVSTYQKFAWTDLLAEAISGALERATTQDEEFRRGLPLGLLGFAGSAFGSLTAASRDDWANRRREAEEFCRSLLARLSGHISLDEAADRIACGQVRDALPPALDPSEASCSAFGAGPVWDARRGRLTAAPPAVTLKSRIRLVRRSAARLTGDGRLHSSLGNTRVFREAEPAYLDVEPALAPGVAALAAAYPTFLTVAELPIADPEDRVALAAGLHDRGLLLLAAAKRDAAQRCSGFCRLLRIRIRTADPKMLASLIFAAAGMARQSIARARRGMIHWMLPPPPPQQMTGDCAGSCKEAVATRDSREKTFVLVAEAADWLQQPQPQQPPAMSWDALAGTAMAAAAGSAAAVVGLAEAALTVGGDGVFIDGRVGCAVCSCWDPAASTAAEPHAESPATICLAELSLKPAASTTAEAGRSALDVAPSKAGTGVPGCPAVSGFSSSSPSRQTGGTASTGASLRLSDRGAAGLISGRGCGDAGQGGAG